MELDDGTRISKHGAQMHCNHCSSAKHNKAGCEILKSSTVEVANEDSLQLRCPTGHPAVEPTRELEW